MNNSFDLRKKNAKDEAQIGLMQAHG